MSPYRAAVLIDGGYLDAVLRDANLEGKIDIPALAAALASPAELYRWYYYHCMPYQSDPPTEEERQRTAPMNKFIERLRESERCMIRLGRLRKIDIPGARPKLKQKQVDVLIAVDIVNLATKRLIQEIVLISGDSDLLPALAIARDEGVIFRLAYGTGRCSPHRELRAHADERQPLDRGFLARFAWGGALSG